MGAITTHHRETILVLDFGAQYSQLIARRVRENAVYCEIMPAESPVEEIAARSPVGIIFSGGPSSVYADDAPKVDRDVYTLGVPILGICYGQQLLAHDLGGNVQAGETGEYGDATITISTTDKVFNALGTPGDDIACWMSHGDKVLQPPQGFHLAASNAKTPVAGMFDPIRNFYGVQFHPEVQHTPGGKAFLAAFLKEVCGCRGEWTPGNIIHESVLQIREKVGNAEVICGVSGGIDSCCVAALMHRAIGDQLTCIFVDHGLLRKGEAEQVKTDFAAAFGIKLIHVDARERFIKKLRGVSDPETKRKIIGEEFVRVFEAEAEKLSDAKFLAQGTLYPDVIESGGSKHSSTIKTHHNVGGLPEDMSLEVIEPLRLLFKDEVRALALEMGVNEEIVWRHPFPGPGLAIRILGEVTEEKIEILQNADAIFIEELRLAGLYREQSQSLAVLPSIKTVGVMGDSRTYAYPIILRSVTTEDFMTARWSRLPYSLLERVSTRIVNEVSGVNRVVYDISSKPPATIEWE